MNTVTVDVSSVNDVHTIVNQFSESFDSIKFIINEDVSDMVLYISTNIDGQLNIIPEDSECIERGTDPQTRKEYIIWTLTSSETMNSGVIVYQIVGAKLNDDGTYESVWLSDEGRLVVKESIDVEDFVEVTARKSPSLFMSLYLNFKEHLNMILQGEFDGTIRLNKSQKSKLPEANKENRGKIYTIYSKTNGDKIYMCVYAGVNITGAETYQWKELKLV